MVPRLVCSFVIVCALVLTGAQAARAVPQDLTQAKDQAATLAAQLQDLKDQAAKLRDAYRSATAALAKMETDAADNAEAFAQAQQDQTAAESTLRARLTQIYKQGRSGTLSILLSASSLPEFMDRISLLQRISKQDSELVAKVTAYRDKVAADGTQLASQLKQQEAATAQVEAARKAMADKLAEAQRLLADKKTEVAQLEAEWKAQLAEQARLEKARQAALQAALDKAQAAAQEDKNGSDGGSGDGGSGGGTTTTTTRRSTTTTTSGSGTGTHHGTINILKPEQIALVAKKAGFSGENLVIAVAVAMAESGSNADAIGRNTYGLWQILSYAHPNMIDPASPDASRWFDPYVNAGFAWSISNHGATWRPWAVYTSGAYLRYMDRARTGVQLLLSDPGAVTPPTVK